MLVMGRQEGFQFPSATDRRDKQAQEMDTPPSASPTGQEQRVVVTVSDKTIMPENYSSWYIGCLT